MNSLSISFDPELKQKFSLPPSQISEVKWQEILEEEYISYIIGSIREEIIRSAADAICKGYLQRAVYSFVSNCVREAWMRAFQVN